MNANDRQVGGDHYGHGKLKMQHWDLVAALWLNYFVGCATKYAERWDKKNGAQDVEKAIHYLQKYKEDAHALGHYCISAVPATMIQDVLKAYFAERPGVSVHVVRTFELLCSSHGQEEVSAAIDQLSALLELARGGPTSAYTNQDGGAKC